MPYFLSDRDTESTERMDNPDCDRDALFNTYQQFATINGLVSGWKQIYNTRLKPLSSGKERTFTLLDIGFGGGDIPINLAKWFARDGISVQITGLETDPRALEFIERCSIPDNVFFEHRSSSDVLEEGRRFDAVISNHLLHHLSHNKLIRLLVEAQQLSKRIVLFNDLERSDLGYALFNIFSRPVFRSSFITHDGLKSIKRSYTLQELRSRVPENWEVERLFPFRLLLSYKHEGEENEQ
jgi:2-polyprenyl-3-methyl-5-hydroxy-6-metoxy-1,4-benzoquinol methylase